MANAPAYSLSAQPWRGPRRTWARQRLGSRVLRTGFRSRSRTSRTDRDSRSGPPHPNSRIPSRTGRSSSRKRIRRRGAPSGGRRRNGGGASRRRSSPDRTRCSRRGTTTNRRSSSRNPNTDPDIRSHTKGRRWNRPAPRRSRPRGCRRPRKGRDCSRNTAPSRHRDARRRRARVSEPF